MYSIRLLLFRFIADFALSTSFDFLERKVIMDG